MHFITVKEVCYGDASEISRKNVCRLLDRYSNKPDKSSR